MNSRRTLSIALLLWVVVLLPAFAQDPDPGGLPEGSSGEQVRFGTSFSLAEGDTADEVVVMGGSAVIDGTVASDVVVLGGSLRLGTTAVVGGDSVVIGGGATVEEGATVRGDMVVMGGSFDAPPSFKAGGEQVVMSPGSVGSFAAVTDWMVRGPMTGRLLLPDLPWMWMLLGLAALVACGMTLIFERPVGNCAKALAARPITCFLVGGLVVLLAGPLTILLLVSVIGIPIIPFLWVAGVLALILGKVGCTRWIGGRVIAEGSAGDRWIAVRSVALGFAILSIACMIPVLGLAVPVILGPLALGAVTVVVHGSLQRERGIAGLGGTGSAGAEPPPSAPLHGEVGPRDGEAGSAASEPQSNAPLPSEVGPREGESGELAGRQVAETPPLGPGPRLETAGFGSRIIAVVVDFVPIALLGGFLDLGLRLTLVVFLLYCVAMWTLRASTLGGMICRIRIVRIDGQPLTAPDAVVRGVASIFSAAFLGLGWLWAAWDSQGQSWHDRAAGTLVVRDPTPAPFG